VLSGGAFAGKAFSEKYGNQGQNIQEDSRSSYGNEINNIDDDNTDDNNTDDANNSEAGSERLQNNISLKNENKISEYKQERQKIKGGLQLQRKEYQKAKEEFLEMRSRIRAEELNPNSDESLNATKVYLNSSINYMIAHLSNVKTNMEHSNGNGTEKTIFALDEKIKLLEAKKAEVTNASSQKELAGTVRSVRELWDDAQKISLAGAGEIVSKKVGKYLEKSEALSDILETKIENLNETGADISDIKVKLASYRSYIKSAQEKKTDADSIYEDKNATREDLEKANNYLSQSIVDINKANKLLREIFEELKNYKTE
jgi:hypothetical protein